MLILFRSPACFSYAALRSLVIWEEPVQRERVWCLAPLKKCLKVHEWSNLPIQRRDMEQTGALFLLKSLLKQMSYRVKRMRKISLICTEGKYHSPILGICFSRAVYEEQCLFNDDECLWHKSLTSEPSLIRKWKDTELSFQLPDTSCLHPLGV